MSLPAGPARVRASDADRERVVAFIRGHWHDGRLTDGEDVEPIEDLYQLEGNQTMWNGGEPGDILGRTRVRVGA